MTLSNMTGIQKRRENLQQCFGEAFYKNLVQAVDSKNEMEAFIYAVNLTERVNSVLRVNSSEVKKPGILRKIWGLPGSRSTALINQNFMTPQYILNHDFDFSYAKRILKKEFSKAVCEARAASVYWVKDVVRDLMPLAKKFLNRKDFFTVKDGDEYRTHYDNAAAYARVHNETFEAIIAGVAPAMLTRSQGISEVNEATLGDLSEQDLLVFEDLVPRLNAGETFNREDIEESTGLSRNRVISSIKSLREGGFFIKVPNCRYSNIEVAFGNFEQDTLFSFDDEDVSENVFESTSEEEVDIGEELDTFMRTEVPNTPERPQSDVVAMKSFMAALSEMLGDNLEVNITVSNKN